MPQTGRRDALEWKKQRAPRGHASTIRLLLNSGGGALVRKAPHSLPTGGQRGSVGHAFALCLAVERHKAFGLHRFIETVTRETARAVHHRGEDGREKTGEQTSSVRCDYPRERGSLRPLFSSSSLLNPFLLSSLKKNGCSKKPQEALLLDVLLGPIFVTGSASSPPPNSLWKKLFEPHQSNVPAFGRDRRPSVGR